MEKNYSSVYDIKDFAVTEVAPKYFDLDNVNQLNVGLIGYTTEIAASMTEDVFNTISTFIREIFPNQAQLPETLYSFAASLQIDDIFAKPSTVPIILFLKEKDIIEKGEKQESQIRFNLDSSMVINVEGKQFMLDYDVAITVREYANDYYYSAQYILDHDNSISTLKNPYIQSRRTRVGESNEPYLAFMVQARQVSRFETIEPIVTNDQINVPTISFEFSDQLAGFDVFYKEPGSDDYIQLEKRLLNTTPINQPFCYYKINEENRVSITFSSRDNYFRPAFNSEIMVRIFTTTGSQGDFPEYSGSNVSVLLESTKYGYNNNIIVFAAPQTGSAGGRDRVSLEGLRRMITEKTSTSGAYNNENDLQLYFSNYENVDNNRVIFIKTRDDFVERLFTAFSIFKGQDNNYYQTNTVYADLKTTNFDVEYDQSNMFILKAGHTFKYDGNSPDRVVMHTKRLSDDLSNENLPYLYANPFLMSVTKKPAIAGYYLNSVDEGLQLDYTYVNMDSKIQFIANNLRIYRNALLGEDTYKITIDLSPSSPLPTDIQIFDADNNFTKFIQPVMALEDNGSEIGYVEFKFVKYELQRDIFSFEATLTTTDYMTLAQKVQMTNVKGMNDGIVDNKLVPMVDCIANVYALVKYPNASSKIPHKFDAIPSLQPYTMTNTYQTTSTPITFILPMTNMRSLVKFIQPVYNDPAYFLRLSSVPLIEAKTMKDLNKFKYFMKLVYTQYRYLSSVVGLKTTNYGIDMKFYNTYGRSKFFTAGDDNQILDRTNIKMHIKVAPTIGTLEDELIRDLKAFIKEYIENVNDFKDGVNAINGYNGIYVSNLTQAIENKFPSVKYMRFVNINEYDSSIQVIENQGIYIDKLSKDARRDYVPEFLTIRLEDIRIDIIRN